MTRSWAPQSSHAFRHDFASIAQGGIGFDLLYLRRANATCDCIELLFFSAIILFCSIVGSKE